MVKVNVLALTRLSLAAAPAFARQRGVIVNIGSILALMPVPGASGYSASKAYVLNFSRALQAELEPAGVTVQAVMPGMVRSEFFGGKPAPFPDHLFMEADTLVATAARALDQGERVCFPTLSDPAGWSGLRARRAGQGADTQRRAGRALRRGPGLTPHPPHHTRRSIPMPLWKIYHPENAFSDDDKQAIAERVTALYTDLPKFYVGLVFQPVPKASFSSAGNAPTISCASRSTISPGRYTRTR